MGCNIHNLIASLEAVPIYKGPAGPPSSSPTTSFIISNNTFSSNKEMFLRELISSRLASFW